MYNLLILLLPLSICASQLSTAPNVLVFIADDLGIGDLSCFGNTSLISKSIDRLCKEGVKLNHHVAAEALCTPSRAAFLTGRYPPRTGLSQGPGTPPVIMYVSGKNGLPEEEVTWAKMLKNYGYRTAAVGKWHLGWNKDKYGDQLHGPLGHGFDSFFGLPFTLVDGFEADITFWTYSGWMSSTKDGETDPLHKHSYALVLCAIVVLAVNSRELGNYIFIFIIIGFFFSWFFLEHFRLHTSNWWQRSYYMEKYLNSMIMKNGTEIVEQPIRLPILTQKLTNASLDFIRDHVSKHSHEEKPFLLYHSFTNVHTPLVPSKKFRKMSPHGFYGDSLLEMDNAIGQILDTLDDLKLTSNTIVYFTSDHGADIALGKRGGVNIPFTGGKGMGAIEGGIRVPGVIRWPGVIKPGSQIDVPTGLLDFWPTLHNILKENQPDAQLPDVSKVDGQSFLRYLKDPNSKPSPRFIRHYCGTDLQATRLTSADGSIYKAYFKRIKLNSEGHCGKNKICSCFGENVEEYLKPKIYNLSEDPLETNALDESSTQYLQLLPNILAEYDAALLEPLPPSQYESWMNVLPRLWMQPCHGFPLCRTY